MSDNKQTVDGDHSEEAEALDESSLEEAAGGRGEGGGSNGIVDGGCIRDPFEPPFQIPDYGY